MIEIFEKYEMWQASKDTAPVIIQSDREKKNRYLLCVVDVSPEVSKKKVS